MVETLELIHDDPTKALQAIDAELTRSAHLDPDHREVIALAAGLAEDSAILLGGSPGLGKTYTAKALATIIGGGFGRSQGTPDLLASDITGSEVFNQATRKNEFRPGPIFQDVYLVDDWNRAGTRELSGLIEALAENQVTAGNETHPLPENHVVIVTQNSQAFKEGTRPVPTAIMDRLAVSLEIPELGTGDWIKVRNKKKHTPVQRIDITKMGEKIRERVANVAIDDELLEYAEEMIEKTREHEAVDKEQTFLHGYRPFDQLLRFASASAVMGGYESLSGSDIQAMGRFVLAHRTVIDIEAQEQADSYTFDRVYEEVLKELPDVSDDE